jgi:phage/plasmid-associated DNA primase
MTEAKHLPIDPITQFVADRCEQTADGRVPVAELTAAWQQWCERHGHPPLTAAAFGRRLRAAVPGLTRTRGRAGEYIGLALVPEPAAAGDDAVDRVWLAEAELRLATAVFVQTIARGDPDAAPRYVDQVERFAADIARARGEQTATAIRGWDAANASLRRLAEQVRAAAETAEAGWRATVLAARDFGGPRPR